MVLTVKIAFLVVMDFSGSQFSLRTGIDRKRQRLATPFSVALLMSLIWRPQRLSLLLGRRKPAQAPLPRSQEAEIGDLPPGFGMATE